MKRKMLISIALVTVMLLNCIMPLFVVNAAEGEEIQLNSKLYTAVKTSLTKQGISFSSNDVTHTITLSEEIKSQVTELNLNENGISDLTGLEAFTSLTHLELSGNNLTKESHLDVLNNLPLNYLDLSTNQIEDVSSIESLISTIEGQNGTIILSGQTVTIVEEAIIDESETSDDTLLASFKLPPILEKAGFIKSVWRNESGIPESDDGFFYPTLYSMTNPITADNNEIVIRIASESGYPYKGLYKLEIYIYDDPTEASSASNLNPAATNMLNGSRFYFYVVVHGSEDTAIATPDTNLYKAIKEQLTAGQKVNKELASYPYEVDAKGEIIYDECTYTTVDDYLVLTIVGESEPSYILDTNTQFIFEYDEEDGTPILGKFYTANFEKTKIEFVSDEGDVTTKEGIKFPHNGDNRNLYIKAYDDAKTFVISNEDLVNKITSLILNNKEIRDLSGLEKFVGLKSYLNVSHNYLDNIDPIYDLQKNKDEFEAKIQEKYNYWLSSREFGNLTKSLGDTKTSKEAADNNVKDISTAISEILNKLKEASEIKKENVTEETVTNEDGTTSTTTKRTPNENYDKEIADKAKEIDEIIKNIYGFDTTDEATGTVTHTKGYIELLAENLGETTSSVKELYNYLSILYSVYNNEYKLTTLLTPELNFLDLEEYLAYEESLKGTTESVKALVAAEVARLGTLESNKALSELDKELLSTLYPINFNGDSEAPLKEYFDEYLKNTPGTRLTWVDKIEEFREMAIYSEMANYCLIKRMEEDTAVSQCYCEEYLKARIQNFEYEGIDTTLEETILEKIENNISDPSDELYTVFKDYMESQYTYTTADGTEENLDVCKGPYTELANIMFNSTVYESVDELAGKIGIDATDEELVAVYNKLANKNIIKSIDIKETIDNLNEYQGDLNLYKEVTVLSGKLVNASSEVSRYITLPKLRKLDISYNAYLEDIARISELTGIRELYANADYLTNISDVNWDAIKYLRKLGLAYNYITDIRPLQNLEHIVDLDVSHNLLAGNLDFNFTKSQKTLMNLDLSYNQLEDITVILEFLDFRTHGNFGNYLAREDTLNINLNNQTINLEVTDPIFLSDYPETINVDLPKIFTQLLAIDVDRTSFGETSQNGRIESEGKYVTLNTRTVGNKEGTVEVIPMSGNGTPVETCVGNGTKAIIKYVVSERTVSKVTIDPQDVEMNLGETKQFTATVEGDNLLDTSVEWQVKDNTSENTVISENGELTIAEDEKAEQLTVIAISKFDATVNDIATVTILDNQTEEPVDPENKIVVTVDPQEAEMNLGETKQFTATVEGEDLEDTTVTWSVEENTSENTIISENGELTIAEDEAAEELKVVATSNADNTVSATAVVTVLDNKTEDPEDPENKIVVTVDPSENVTVKPGETKEFTATVEGKDLEDTTVTWSVEDNTSANTIISEDGKLTVAEDETADTIKVIATSNADNTVNTVVTVTIEKEAEEPEQPDLGLGYKVDKESITDVSPKTPIEDFTTILVNGKEYKVVVMKDEEVITSGFMQTGMKVEIQDENGEAVKDSEGNKLVYEVIVKGDINGDGYANSIDSLLMKAYRNEVKNLGLPESYFKAADINDDGSVDVTDSKLLLYHRAEVKGYDLNFDKK